jgi:hypothetical protein
VAPHGDRRREGKWVGSSSPSSYHDIVFEPSKLNAATLPVIISAKKLVEIMLPILSSKLNKQIALEHRDKLIIYDHEINKKAVLDALKNPESIDQLNIVQLYRLFELIANVVSDNIERFSIPEDQVFENEISGFPVRLRFDDNIFRINARLFKAKDARGLRLLAPLNCCYDTGSIFYASYLSHQDQHYLIDPSRPDSFEFNYKHNTVSKAKYDANFKLAKYLLKEVLKVLNAEEHIIPQTVAMAFETPLPPLIRYY